MPEMVGHVVSMIDLGINGDDLTTEERNLVSVSLVLIVLCIESEACCCLQVAYKHLISQRRMAWRQIEKFEEKEVHRTSLCTHSVDTQMYHTPILHQY